MKICRKCLNLVTNDQKYMALYRKTYKTFTVAGDIKTPQNRSLGDKWYQDVRIHEQV